MYRYTTPYHRFRLPIEISRISKLFITYSQYDTVLVEKTLDDCTILDDYTVQIHLSQTDTATFEVCEHNHKIELQVTILTITGERMTSKILKLTAGKSLKAGEITNA